MLVSPSVRISLVNGAHGNHLDISVADTQDLLFIGLALEKNTVIEGSMLRQYGVRSELNVAFWRKSILAKAVHILYGEQDNTVFKRILEIDFLTFKHPHHYKLCAKTVFWHSAMNIPQNSISELMSLSVEASRCTSITDFGCAMKAKDPHIIGRIEKYNPLLTNTRTSRYI
jgi:hypothetical protein